MAHFAEYDRYDAVGLAELVKRREVKPLELLQAALKRSAEYTPRFNAVSHLMDEEARRTAAAPPAGPLQGVPFLLKDLNILYKGAPTTHGSRYFAGNVADHDWELTRRYRAAGLVIFGKTSTPELGLNMSTEPRAFGPTRNPWNPEHSAGGSSGGAAAAVAAGILPVAHATDGGGSIRIPASFCGLVGLKPTRGRISFAPDLGEGWAGLGTPHVVSRTVRDSAAFLDVAAGPGVGDPYFAAPPGQSYLAELDRPPGALRIAYSTDAPSGVGVHEECRIATENAARLCEQLGHVVTAAAPTIDWPVFIGAVKTIIGANVWTTLQARTVALGRPPGAEDLEVITRLWAERGRSTSAADYIRATQVLHATGRRIASFMDGRYDLILTPTLSTPAIKLGTSDMMGADLDKYLQDLFGRNCFNPQYNASGQPAITLPLHWSKDGLPVGVQFAARYGDEALLLRIASQIEQAFPWAGRRPTGL